MSGKSSMRDTVAALGVIASMVFVGWELRQSNVQARAAAYQEIGIATAEFHLGIDDRLAQLLVDQNKDPSEGIANWSAVDWHRVFRNWLGAFRLWETLQLQVEQGVLGPEALERLGYSNTPNVAWGSLGFVCLWPRIRANTSSSLISLIEGAAPDERPVCPVEVPDVL